MKVDTAPRRVVIDTNVWISAALSRHGAPARFVRQALERQVPIFSTATFAEFQQRLWRPKFDPYLSIELRNRILHDANAAAEWFEIPLEIANLQLCRDADDDKFIHVALAAQAGWLVTGDADLLVLGAVSGVRILPPAEALQQIASN